MKLTLIALLGCLLSACNMTQQTLSYQQKRLSGSYELKRINDKSVESWLGGAYHPENHPMLDFQQESLLAGYSGCNRFFGKRELVNGILRLKSGGSTKMSCPKPQAKLETLIMDALNQGAQVSLKGDSLTLKGDGYLLFYLKDYSAN